MHVRSWSASAHMMTCLRVDASQVQTYTYAYTFVHMHLPSDDDVIINDITFDMMYTHEFSHFSAHVGVAVASGGGDEGDETVEPRGG